jgi:hypothetical protein
VAVALCLIAGAVETLVFHNAVSHINPDWNVALAASRLGLLTSLVGLIASIGGLLQRPAPVAVAICIVGIVVGLVGLTITGFIEMLSHASFSFM